MRLIDSIIIMIGIKRGGVPIGRKWAIDVEGWFRMPKITVANHRGTAKAMFMESWVVGVKV